MQTLTSQQLLLGSSFTLIATNVHRCPACKISLEPNCFFFGPNDVASLVADLVLKDKIFVYDLANMRMGWADYDCKHTFLEANNSSSFFFQPLFSFSAINTIPLAGSMSVNVTTSSGKNQYVNTGQHDVNGSTRRASCKSLIPAGIAAMVVHMLLFGGGVSRR